MRATGDMRGHAAEAVALLRHRKRSELDSNRLLLLALTRLVEIVGEAARRVPLDHQARHPSIPWADIIGMRNRLTHGYDSVDVDVLWKTVRDRLPQLVKSLDSILDLRPRGR